MTRSYLSFIQLRITKVFIAKHKEFLSLYLIQIYSYFRAIYYNSFFFLFCLTILLQNLPGDSEGHQRDGEDGENVDDLSHGGVFYITGNLVRATSDVNWGQSRQE